MTLGVPRVMFEVLGANFDGTAQVFVDGQPAVYTTLVDSGTLQVTTSESVSATLGIHQFSVQQNSGTSNASPLTVYVPQQAPLVMNALPSYLVANETAPPSVVVGDINGDGFADVLVPIWNDNEIAILHGNADGSLSPPQFLSIMQAYAVAVGDMNGDGNADLVSISSDNYQASTVSVLLADGHGNLQPASQQTISGIYPTVVGRADLDGDGQPDLVLQVQPPEGYNLLVWLRNTGNGNFAPPVTLAYLTEPHIALADFNRDGKPDLIYRMLDVTTGNSFFHLLLNKGGGTFNDQAPVGFNGIVGIPTAIDFNLDGIPDLVVQQIQSTTTTILYSFRGNGDGSFTQVGQMNLSLSYDFVTADFDHDGFPDLAGANGQKILYLFGDGHGNFTPQEIVGSGTTVVGLGDINGDGLPDIVASDYSNFVTVSLGRKDRSFSSPLVLSPPGWGSVTLGDVNGDGFPDIFVGGVDDPADSLYLPGTVFLNQGNNSFASGVYTDPSSFAIENLTSKGADLMGTTSSSLVIWPNNGTSTFSPSPITVPTISLPGPVHIADMDGDGHPDIVTFNEIFFGNGSYQFTSVPLAIGPNFAVGDFNGDGRLDIISGSSVFLNKGNRRFQGAATNIPQGLLMAVGDFNGDGKDDMVLSDGGPTLSIWYSNGDGTFYQAAELNIGQQAGAFLVGDFNGDGRVDLAVALYLSNEVAMFFNQPGGEFTLSYFASGPGAYSMRAADLNGNGKLDFVMETYPPNNPPTTVNVVFHK